MTASLSDCTPTMCADSKPTAYLNYEVLVKCPHCKKDFDLISDNDDEGEISRPIFNNNWDALKGRRVVCDYCAKAFKIKKVVY